MPAKLTPADLLSAAKDLVCDLPAIQAVVEVESGALGGFDAATGRPIILFEPHVFSNLTAGRFDASHPELSYRKWGARPYPRGQAERWAQLEAARLLDGEAADKSASWGLFQILGRNWSSLGYVSIAAFVAAMHQGEPAHLLAFVRFVQVNRLAEALRRHRWEDFARGYNGPGYAAHGYHTRLAEAWRRHAGQG